MVISGFELPQYHCKTRHEQNNGQSDNTPNKTKFILPGSYKSASKPEIPVSF